MKSPWEVATGKTEHGEQAALFGWANVAYWAGFDNAWNRSFYTLPTPLKGFMAIGPTQPHLRWFHAIHNQGHGDAIRGGQAKAEGVKAGIPDTFLPVPLSRLGSVVYAGLYIELKLPMYATRKGGGLSDDQTEALAYLESVGYRCRVAYGWEQAARAVQEYLQTP